MVQSEEGDLHPFDFDQLLKLVPEVARLDAQIETWQPWEPMDSSDMQPEHWALLAKGMDARRKDYDGFVVLHGTDTMAYTASALSFMLLNFGKPVVFTGSQLPVGILRSDARENLITALELAMATDAAGAPMLQEVAIYFEYQLLRANRAYKRSSQNFNAFESPNYPPLAEAGVSLHIKQDTLWRPTGTYQVHPVWKASVGVLILVPGLSQKMAEAICLNTGCDVVVLHTFGSGNAPNWEWLPELIDAGQQRGISFLNASQCRLGGVRQPAYAASRMLRHAGVLSAGDMTLEAVVTKSMWLLGQGKVGKAFETAFAQNLAGERSL
jgi:L-asparaginase